MVIAADDAAETGRGSTTMLDVLGNDSAAGGVTLTITQINGQNVSAGDSVTLLSGTVVTLNEDGTLTFETADQLGEETLSYTISDSSDNTDVGFIAINVTCFASGTGIMTPRGEVPINHLSVDDLVKTRDHGAQPLRWIGSTQLGADKLDAFPHLRPIRVTAGALGRDLPVRDLVVSPQHRILVRSRIAQKMFGTNEVLVAAKQLLQLDGVEIAADLQIVEYFHMLFDRHEVVISDGAESESLYTGPEALKALPAAVADEVFTLFPELRDAGHIPVPARPLASGRMARRLTVRHVQNNRPLISAI